MPVRDRDAIAVGRLFHGEERRPARQLLEERGGGAARAGDDGIEVDVVVELKSPGVHREERAATGVVGQGDLHGLVDATWPFRQGGLEQIRAVGGQQEGHVRVGVGVGVELVEHVKEQRLRSARERAVLRDEVAVLQHHECRLQQPGQ